jgi:hypothetical protein
MVYGSVAELAQAASTIPCSPPVKTVKGTVTGLGPQQVGWLWLGNGGAIARSNGAVEWSSDGPAVQHLVGVRLGQGTDGNGFGGAVDRLIIRRGLTPSSGSTLAPLDFGSAESFAPVTGNLMATGMGNGPMNVSMSYFADSASFSALSSTRSTLPTTYPGVPPGRQRPGELHYASFCTDDVVNGPLTYFRCLSASFKDAGDRTFNATFLPESDPILSVRASTPYLRPVVNLTSAADVVHFLYTGTESTHAYVVVWMSRAYVNGGSSWEIELPDFTGLAGWNPAWAPSEVTNWIIDATQMSVHDNAFFLTPNDGAIQEILTWTTYSLHGTAAASNAVTTPIMLPTRSFMGHSGLRSWIQTATARGVRPQTR